MKKKLLPIYIVLLCSFVVAGKAQYIGGSADGFASAKAFLPSCPAQPNTNIYFGGNADGSAFHSFIASICPAPANTNIYFGGNADGSAFKSLIASICPPLPSTNVYFGGNADGFAYSSKIISICPPLPSTSIYYGGNAAGYRLGTIITAACAVLPIELLSFTGDCQKQKTILKWTTATEIDNNYFTVESSTDGSNWKIDGTHKGAGNSTSTLNYTFTDTVPTTTPVTYYRLKQTDYNGKYKYFDIISIENCSNTGDDNISIYPNASTGIFNVLFSGNKTAIYSTDVFNGNGQKIYSANGFQSKIDLSNQPTGVYNLQLNLPAKSINTKVIIAK